jgi:hypothetical protein
MTTIDVGKRDSSLMDTNERTTAEMHGGDSFLWKNRTMVTMITNDDDESCADVLADSGGEDGLTTTTPLTYSTL